MRECSPPLLCCLKVDDGAATRAPEKKRQHHRDEEQQDNGAEVSGDDGRRSSRSGGKGKRGAGKHAQPHHYQTYQGERLATGAVIMKDTHTRTEVRLSTDPHAFTHAHPSPLSLPWRVGVLQ